MSQENELAALLVAALVSGLGTAVAMGLAFRADLARFDKRITRAESRIGITEDGVLTGNGLIQDVANLKG